MKVRLIKALCFGGERREPDTEVEVSDSLARELVAQRRAAPVGELKPLTGPMTIETAGALVDPAKGKANARS